MIAIDNTIVSEHLLEKKFVCDINACKGECCVAGDSGAPLEIDEIAIMEDILDKVLPYVPKDGQKAIKKQGVFVIDEDGDYTTPLVKGAHCAFTYFEEGIAKCAIEKAYYAGEVSWKKPVSCHLYPVRITKYKNYDAVNYHKWEVCKPACECGAKLDVPVYKFLKEPLIRKFGKDWYKQLELAAELKKA
jgi:hypothetical protein